MLASWSPGIADTLPAATGFIGATADNVTNNQDATSGTSTASDGLASATATLSIQPFPTATVSASATEGGSTGTGTVFLNYNIEVVPLPGAPDITQVPIIITTSGTVTQPLASSNIAAVYFNGGLIAGACQGSPIRELQRCPGDGVVYDRSPGNTDAQ
jgi:hypothetical protein